jgi:heme oxygenase
MTARRLVVDVLRADTHAAHTALDQGFDTVDRLAVVAERGVMLGRYYCLHAAAERAMVPFLQDDQELDMPSRARSAVIARGLDAVGAERPGLVPALAIGSRAAALGALYVVEGSTLGGRGILRALRDRGVDTAGLEFLDPYGAQCGAMWRAVLAVLERDLAEAGALVEACAAASATFDLARDCLGAPLLRAA